MPLQQEDTLKHRMRTALCDQIVSIRNRRRWVEQGWLNSRRTWMNIWLEPGYIPRSRRDAYRVPSARRVIERAVVRIVKLLTPNVKWFEVAPLGNVTQDRLSNVDAFMWYVLRKRIKSRSNISQLARSMCLYGEAILKTSIAISNNQAWPTQRAVDPFSFYVFPETCTDLDEADLVFEDFMWSYEKYKTFVAKGIVDDIPFGDLTKPDWPYHLTERLAYQGITSPDANVSNAIARTNDELNKTSSAFVSVTEVWIKREDRLYQVYIVWNLRYGARITGFIKSEYDSPLYRKVIHRPLPGEAYTNSQMADIQELETLQTDQLNKFQDAVDWEQGFVIAPAQQRHESWKMGGRELWLHQGDPREIQFMQPPVTSTNQLRAWQIYLALQNSLGGAGTIAEGQPGRNMPRAGFAMNNLINLGMSDLQDVAELLEQELLTYSLGDVYAVSHFIPSSQLMKIPGASTILQNGQRASIISRNDLQGSFEFEWVGSLQFQDENERAQRLMIFMNSAIQLQQLLVQQGYTFDFPELVQMVFRSGLGERGLSKIVKPLPQQGMGQQGMPMGGNGQGTANGEPKPNSELQYRLPSVTSGFIRR